MEQHKLAGPVYHNGGKFRIGTFRSIWISRVTVSKFSVEWFDFQKFNNFPRLSEISVHSSPSRNFRIFLLFNGKCPKLFGIFEGEWFKIQLEGDYLKNVLSVCPPFSLPNTFMMSMTTTVSAIRSMTRSCICKSQEMLYFNFSNLRDLRWYRSTDEMCSFIVSARATQCRALKNTT